MQHAIEITSGFRQFSGVEAGDLVPALPSGIPRLLEVITDANVDFSELSDEIAKFPSIAARLLFLANSSWAAPSSPISKLQQACAKLGLSVVRSVAISLSIAAPFNPNRCPKFQSARFWMGSLMVADAARQLGILSDKIAEKDVPVLHTAAVLHSLGMLWFADRFPEEMGAVIDMVTEHPESNISEAMRTVSGSDYCEIGGELAQAWNLPLILEVSIREHNHYGYQEAFWPIVQSLGCATKLVDACAEDAEQDVADIRLERLGVSEAQAREVIVRLKDQQESYMELVNSMLSPMN